MDYRKVLTGIIFVLKTGIPWEELPQEMGCGCGMSCLNNLNAWQRAGVWKELHEILLAELEEADKLDWSRAAVDSAKARALGGSDQTGPNPTDRGKPGTKHHVLTDGQGVPLVTHSTGANVPDVNELLPQVDDIPPVRGEADRPRRLPENLYADRAYDSQPHREELKARGIDPPWRGVGLNMAVAWGFIAGWQSEPSPGCTNFAGSSCGPIERVRSMMPSSRWLQLSYVCGSYETVILLGALSSQGMIGCWVGVPVQGVFPHMMSPNNNANRTSQSQQVGQDATLGLEAALRSHLSGVLLKSVPLAAYPQPVQIIKYDFATISSPAIAGMQEIERGLIYHREDVVPGSSRRDLRAGFLLGWIDDRKLHVLLGRGAQMYTAWHASELQAYLIVTSSDEFKSLFANAADGRIEMQAQEPLDLDGARYIYHIAVKPAVRRLGLGQVLLEAVKQDQNQPLVTDIAISPVNNAASLSFMHKHGFRNVALVFDHSFPWAETVISQAMAWEPAPFDHSCGGHALCNAHHLRLKGEQPVTGCYAALSEAAAPISITSHSYADISHRIETLAEKHGYNVSVIGHIEDNGRSFPLYKVTIGQPDTANLRVLITAGTHGEEPGAVHSALEFLESTATNTPTCYFEVYPCINPSSFERGCRKNSQGRDVNRCFKEGSDVPEVIPFVRSLSGSKFDVAIDLHEDKNDEPEEASPEPPPFGLHIYESSRPGAELAREVLASFPSELVYRGTSLYGDECRDGVINSRRLAASSIFAQGAGDFEGFAFQRIANHTLTFETCIFAQGADGEMSEIPLARRVAYHQQMISEALKILLKRQAMALS